MKINWAVNHMMFPVIDVSSKRMVLALCFALSVACFYAVAALMITNGVETQ